MSEVDEERNVPSTRDTRWTCLRLLAASDLSSGRAVGTPVSNLDVAG